MKIGFLFPGQGSQYLGMGKEFFEKYAPVKEIFDQAGKILGYDLKKIIFEGPEEKLRETEITQPAVFTVDFVCFKVFNYQLSPPKADPPQAETINCLCAGHSLGECAAIVSAGVVNFKEGLRLVKKRAQFIREESQKKSGKMVAILGISREKTEKICLLAKTKGIVEAVNFNCPGQVVISGEEGAVDYAAELAKGSGAKIVFLKVSGPFHSSLMRGAAEKMANELENYQFANPQIPVITNCDAKVTNSAKEIKKKLIQQIDHPVLWEDTVKEMISQGINVFIEVGPGKVLSGLTKRINPQAKIYNIENEESLHNCLRVLNV